MNLKLSAAEVKERVAWAMEVTGTRELKDRPTHALSFGQKKRVAIAGVLAMQPEIMIFDEPTAGLDPSGVSEIMHLLRKTQEELGITIILSTHDIDMVPLYCDQAYVMHRGRWPSGAPPVRFSANGRSCGGWGSGCRGSGTCWTSCSIRTILNWETRPIPSPMPGAPWSAGGTSSGRKNPRNKD